MKYVLLGLAVFLSAALAPAVLAQTLQDGTWTGTVTPPNGEVIEVTYEVHTMNDTLHIRIATPQFGSFDFKDIVVKDDALLFSWTPGNDFLTCDLKRRDDGSYEGECVDAGGVPGVLLMRPPGSEQDHDQHDGGHQP